VPFASRRDFIGFGGAAGGFFAAKHPEPSRPLVITVQAMFDQGAHSGKGLKVKPNFPSSGTFRKRRAANTPPVESASMFACWKGLICGSKATRKSLRNSWRGAINLFVTDTLGYDIDRDRTGGCSMGPRPPSRRSGGDPFYKTFLGLRDARDTTLAHEYAHHFTLDTRRNPTAAATSGPIFGTITGFGCSATVCRFGVPRLRQCGVGAVSAFQDQIFRLRPTRIRRSS
jgi:hypothetical protein